MFNYLGIHADKHVRQHAVYEIVPEGKANSEVATAKTPTNQISPTPAGGLAPGALLEETPLVQAANQLANYIGPLAPILVKKAVKAARSLDHLYHVLADDVLSTEEQKRQFLDSRQTIY